MDDPFKAQQPRGLQPESYVNTPLIDAIENSGVFFYLYTNHFRYLCNIWKKLKNFTAILRLLYL